MNESPDNMPEFSVDDESVLIWDDSSKTYKSVPKTDRPLPNHPFGTDPARDRMTPKDPSGAGMLSQSNLYTNGEFPTRIEKPHFESYDNSFPSEINPIGDEPDLDECPDCGGQMVADGDQMQCARCEYKQPVIYVSKDAKIVESVPAAAPLIGGVARLLLPAGAAGGAAEGTVAAGGALGAGSMAGSLMRGVGQGMMFNMMMGQNASKSGPAMTNVEVDPNYQTFANYFGPGAGAAIEISGEDAGFYLTDGLMHDTGGSPEFYKGVSEGGSSTGIDDFDINKQIEEIIESLTPEQTEALNKMQENLPLILFYASDPDQDGSEDPVIQDIDESMEAAFPGYKDLMEQLEEIEDLNPEDEEGESDSPVKESYTMREKRIASHFLGSMEGIQRQARRLPKMCPYHKNLVEFSLSLGDPATAHTLSQGKNECGTDSYEDNCKFKPAMVTESYWEERDLKRQERQNAIDTHIEQSWEHESPNPAEDTAEPALEESYEEVSIDLSTVDAPSGDIYSEPVTASSGDESEHNFREACDDQDCDCTAEAGECQCDHEPKTASVLVPGQVIELADWVIEDPDTSRRLQHLDGKRFEVVDVVTDHAPDGRPVEFLRYRDPRTGQEGYDYASYFTVIPVKSQPLPDSPADLTEDSPSQIDEMIRGARTASDPTVDVDDPINEDPTTVVVDVDSEEIEAGWTDVEGEPLKEGQKYRMKSPEYSVPDLITVEGIEDGTLTYIIENAEMRYRDKMDMATLAANAYEFEPLKKKSKDHRAASSVHGDILSSQRPVTAPKTAGRIDQHLQHTAGYNYGPSEQREFIDEGIGSYARNIHKLRTEGSHYPSMDEILRDIESGGSSTDDHFLWG